jgi:hypothetical protein
MLSRGLAQARVAPGHVDVGANEAPYVIEWHKERNGKIADEREVIEGYLSGQAKLAPRDRTDDLSTYAARRWGRLLSVPSCAMTLFLKLSLCLF